VLNYSLDIWIWGDPMHIPWKITEGRQSYCPLLAKLKVLAGTLTDLSAYVG
jgi:hypothetical protein